MASKANNAQNIALRKLFQMADLVFMISLCLLYLQQGLAGQQAAFTSQQAFAFASAAAFNVIPPKTSPNSASDITIIFFI
jgi:hypothetical protein